METFVSNFIGIFITLSMIVFISLIWWGITYDFFGPKAGKKARKYFTGPVCLIWFVLFIFGFAGESTKTYRISLNDVTSSVLIDSKGIPDKIYKWKEFVLPPSIANYIKYDSIKIVCVIFFVLNDSLLQNILDNQNKNM
jgi:hypothetical protein